MARRQCLQAWRQALNDARHRATMIHTGRLLYHRGTAQESASWLRLLSETSETCETGQTRGGRLLDMAVRVQ
jgi:hypothetical protein